MAAGIVPEIIQRVGRDFQGKTGSDRKIKGFLRKLEAGAATAADVAAYAQQVGRCASYALCRNLDSESLPGGRLTEEIAQGTIIPVLKQAHEMVMDAAKRQQEAADKAIGIHLNPVVPAFPYERVVDMINKLAEYQEEDEAGGADG